MRIRAGESCHPILSSVRVPAASSTRDRAPAHTRAAHLPPPKPNLPQPKLFREMNGKAGTGCPHSSVQPCLHQTLQKAKPHISKSPARLFALLPSGLSQNFCSLNKRDQTATEDSVSECLFLVCWYLSAPASDKLLAAITNSGLPK